MPKHPRVSDEYAEFLCRAVASGKSGRGVSCLCRPELWQEASEMFAPLERVAVISGFFVPAAGSPETDGPGGAVILARAFLEQGRTAEIWTDALCSDALRQCGEAVGFPSSLVKTPKIDEILDTYDPQGIIFTERLGRAADGRYYNASQKDITKWTAPLDELALLSAGRGIKTLGIGDGGNEAGMGCFYDELSTRLPDFANSLSIVKTDIALPVDVSNWGAYAFTAALSRVWGAWRGHREGEERAMLEALCGCHAVDGISHRCEPSVDGFSLAVHEALASQLREIWGIL